jgi:hypothetical protein
MFPVFILFPTLFMPYIKVNSYRKELKYFVLYNEVYVIGIITSFYCILLLLFF